MEFQADQIERVDKFLARMMPEFSRSKLAKWIEDEGVYVDGVQRKASFRVEPGMLITLEDVEATAPHDLTPVERELEVLFEDEHLLVLNKPRGLASHPAVGLKEPTLVNVLLGRAISLSSGSADYRPGIVHRLDKETTGLMVVAKTDNAHRGLATQIAEKTAERRYVGVATGRFQHQRMKVEAPIGRDPRDRRRMMVDPKGKRALTHFKQLAECNGNTVFAARLETGRTHQIRVHLLAVNHPIIGDSIYAKNEIADGPLQLHSAYLAFKHPETNEAMAFFTPPPPDFMFSEFVFESALSRWD